MTDVATTRLAVVGTGLIGASIALAAKRAGVPQVAGFDSDRTALAAAAELGAIDVEGEALQPTVADADLVVVATPVGAIASCVTQVLAATGEGCTVTDVGSTKASICSALAHESRFVGGHPLAGSEARGPTAARADLFDGSTWFLTTTAGTDPERHRLAGDVVRALGAEVVEIDPTVHDQLVALVSHLPHALARALVHQVSSAQLPGHDALATTGASFKDMTRVAGANPGVWVDIFLDNAEALGAALSEHRRYVVELEELLDRGDRVALTEWVEESARKRPR